MPLFVYKCEDNHKEEHLEKVYDPDVRVCATCGKPSKRTIADFNFRCYGDGFYKQSMTDDISRPWEYDESGMSPEPEAEPFTFVMPTLGLLEDGEYAIVCRCGNGLVLKLKSGCGTCRCHACERQLVFCDRPQTDDPWGARMTLEKGFAALASLAGFTLIIVGIGMVWRPLGFVAGGVFLIAWAVGIAKTIQRNGGTI